MRASGSVGGGNVRAGSPRSVGGRNLPGCKSACAVHISAASWPIEPLWAGESSKICPHAATFSPRKFLPPTLLEVAQTLNHATGADGQQLQGIGAPTQPYAVAVRQDDAIAFGQQTLGKQLLHRGAGSGGGILPLVAEWDWLYVAQQQHAPPGLGERRQGVDWNGTAVARQPLRGGAGLGQGDDAAHVDLAG